MFTAKEYEELKNQYAEEVAPGFRVLKRGTGRVHIFLAWVGKAKKPTYDMEFRTPEERDQALQKTIQKYLAGKDK